MSKRLPSLVILFERISQFIVLLTIFFIPLFSFPLLSDFPDKAKQVFLLFAVSLAMLFYLMSIALKREIYVVRHPAMAGVAALCVILVIAALFGNFSYQSIFGFERDSAHVLSSFVAYFLFFWLVVWMMRQPLALQKILFFILLSGYSVFLLAVFWLIGTSSTLGYLIPGLKELTGMPLFNTIGALEQFALFMAVVCSTALITFFDVGTKKNSSRGRSVLRFCLVVLIVGSFGFVALSGQKFVLGALLTLFFLLSCYFIRQARIYHRGWSVLLPMMLFAFGLLFLFARPSFLPTLPSSGVSTQKPTFDIAANVALRAVRVNPFFGFGPASYRFVYSRFYPEYLNNTSLWNARFEYSYSGVLALITDSGVVGGMVWLFVIFVVVLISVRSFVRERTMPRVLYPGLCMVWLMFVVAMFFMNFSLTLELLFWIYAALLIGLSANHTGHTLVRSSIIPSGAVAVAASIAVGLVLIVRVANAEMLYQRARNEGLSSDSAIVHLNRARLWSRHDDRIVRLLAENILARFERGLQAKKSEDELRGLAQSALELAEETLRLNYNDTRNLNLAAVVYTTVAPSDSSKALDYLTQATKLEPNNPVFFYQLGTLYVEMYEGLLRKGDSPDKKNMRDVLTRAESFFREALLLHHSYASAYIGLGHVYGLRNNIPRALEFTERGYSLSSGDMEAGLQLALFYIQDNQKKRAAEVLDALITSQPDYANALLYRALLYKEEGNKNEARRLFESILTYNPDSVEVKQQLQALQ